MEGIVIKFTYNEQRKRQRKYKRRNGKFKNKPFDPTLRPYWRHQLDSLFRGW